MRGHPRLPLQAEGARWSHSIGVLEPRVPQRPTMLSRRAERENQEPSCASVTDSGGASDAIAPDLKNRIKWTRFRHTQVWAWREKDYFLTSEHLVSLSGWVTSSAGMRRNATDASERRTAPWLLRPGTRRSRAIWAASCWGPCARPSPAPDKPLDVPRTPVDLALEFTSAQPCHVTLHPLTPSPRNTAAWSSPSAVTSACPSSAVLAPAPAAPPLLHPLGGLVSFFRCR